MDQIKVEGIKVYAHHGVLESEKTQGQWFTVDCDCFLDTSNCRDELDRTVNYAQLSEEVVRFCQTTQFDLIETLANELAQHLLINYDLMQDIIVTVHKPQAPITVPFSDVAITVKRGWKTCYLGIGSNLGDREQNLNLVSVEIEKDPKVIELAKSAYIETEPYGVTDQPRFLNGAIKIKTIYTPVQLLGFCKQIEERSGRVKTRRWGERTLDVDILLYSDEVIFTELLIVPHPELHLRAFVLEPLCEIEPYLIHPIKRCDIQTLWKEVNEQNARM